MEKSESFCKKIDSEIFMNGKNLNNPVIVSYNKKGIDPISVNYNKRVQVTLFIKYKKRGLEQIEEQRRRKTKKKESKKYSKMHVKTICQKVK